MPQVSWKEVVRPKRIRSQIFVEGRSKESEGMSEFGEVDDGRSSV